MSTSVAPNGAESPPPFWSHDDYLQLKDRVERAADIARQAVTIGYMADVRPTIAQAMITYLEMAAGELFKEADRIAKRCPVVVQVGDTLIKGSREEIDDILDGLDDDVNPLVEGGAS